MNPAPLDRPQSLEQVVESDRPVIDLSIIIVNYNVREFLEQAIRSVYKAATDLQVEVFVVDNASSDGSVEMVRSRFPDVYLIANEENVGFGKANNQAIRKAGGRYVLILNPDTIVQEDTLDTLVRFMDDHPDAGAAGCKILNPDGTFAPESKRSFPTPAIAFYRMIGLSKLFPHSAHFGRYNLSYLSPDKAVQVDALSGSCMLVRRTVIDETGMFDEDFFMYGEDLDWCYRIQQAGWKIHYTPDTQIIHYKGESTKKGELRYVLLFYGAMLHFMEKHFKKRHSFLFRVFLRMGIVAHGSLQAMINWTRRFPLINGRGTLSVKQVRRTILVGDEAEAGRLQATLSTLPNPPLDLIGYVSPDECVPSNNGSIPCLGTTGHLEELVRLRDIHNVVFASRIVPNRITFDVMQQLQDLPVHFRMLNEEHEHLIGQASIVTLTGFH